MAYKRTNPIKQLIEKGKMLSSAKGSSNYMKEDPGSPAKHLMGGSYGNEVKHSHNDTKNQSVDSLRGSGKSKHFTRQQLIDKGFITFDKPAKTDIKPPTEPETKNPKTPSTPSKKAEIVGSVKASSEKDNTPSAAQTAASKLEQKAKTAISKRKKARKTKDGVNAVIEHQNKKQAASKIKDTKTKSKAEIRSAKTTAKQAGKSKQEIRLAKTKAKAKNARIETTSKETAAQGGKKAQEKRAKTIRLEKRAKRIEGRIAKRKAKK